MTAFCDRDRDLGGRGAWRGDFQFTGRNQVCKTVSGTEVMPQIFYSAQQILSIEALNITNSDSPFCDNHK